MNFDAESYARLLTLTKQLEQRFAEVKPLLDASAVVCNIATNALDVIVRTLPPDADDAKLHALAEAQKVLDLIQQLETYNRVASQT